MAVLVRLLIYDSVSYRYKDKAKIPKVKAIQEVLKYSLIIYLFTYKGEWKTPFFIDSSLE